MTLHIKCVTCSKWCNFHFEGVAECTRYLYTISLTNLERPHKKKWKMDCYLKMTFLLPYSSQIDEIWTTVAKAVVGGTLGSAANVFASDNETYVICIYTEDFTNKEEVWAAEKSLRKLGVKFTLRYKPNIYTTLGIYAGNEWHLIPTIYRSRI